MKAFWWFKQNSVAGMARPGFNGIRWFDMPYEESIVFAWIGQRTSATYPLTEFKTHLREYGALARPFFNMDDTQFENIIESFNNLDDARKIFTLIADKTKCIEHFEITPDQISFRLNQERLSHEIDFMKKNGVGTIVTLTENHNQKDELAEHFDLHHLAIDDMHPPTFEQAEQLAEIFRQARAQNKNVVVHCMAGIGRTSTMIISAHLILGEDFDELKTLIQAQNPTYKLSGSQFNFVNSVAERLKK